MRHALARVAVLGVCAPAAPAAAPGGSLRLVVIGDAGHGNDAQYEVAAAIGRVCAARGCDLVLTTGDNFYPSGVSSPWDSAFEDKFERPYAHVDLPFYASLGNHDWMRGSSGADAQVAYTWRSDKWKMPGRYYAEDVGDVTLIALDTTSIDWGDGEAQERWIEGVHASATRPWRIAFGHHPYRSNGEHGDADSALADFFEERVCGRVDLYLAGHDHTLQWLHPSCGVELVVSGAAASTDDLDGHDDTFFGADDLGFLWAEIEGDSFTGVFYDEHAEARFERTFRR